MATTMHQSIHRFLPLRRTFLVLVAASALFCWAPRLCEAMPNMLIESGKTKCYIVEAPVDTILRIDYEARDIPLEQEGAGANPSYLDINVQPLNRISRGDLHEAPVRDHLKPTREVLTTATGTVYHKMEVDGNANVCLRAPRRDLRKQHQAKKHDDKKVPDRKIFRYALRIQATDEVPEKFTPPQANVDDHLTYMEMEMKRIKTSMQTILRQADFAKDKDAEMHKQFEALHSTAFYWPMMQVFVLLITGFAQVRNIVQFFKSRRII